jgi:hypothetical protein
VVLLATVVFGVVGAGLLGGLSAAGWFKFRAYTPYAPAGGSYQSAPEVWNPSSAIETVHVDNYSGQDVEIESDGRFWLRASQGSTHPSSLTRGYHTIVVKNASTHQQVDSMGVDVNSGPYILNVLGTGSYTKGEAWYDRVPALGSGGEPTPTTLTAKWIYAKVDYLFQDPPQTIQVSQYSMRTIKTYLVRGIRTPILPGLTPKINLPGGNIPSYTPPASSTPGYTPPGGYNPGYTPPGGGIPGYTPPGRYNQGYTPPGGYNPNNTRPSRFNSGYNPYP